MDVISKDQTLNFLNDLFGEMETVSFNDVLLSFERLSSAFEGMTNGEVLQAIISGLEPIVLSNETGAIYFDWDWWNAPYQKGGENE